MTNQQMNPQTKTTKPNTRVSNPIQENISASELCHHHQSKFWSAGRRCRDRQTVVRLSMTSMSFVDIFTSFQLSTNLIYNGLKI